MNYRERIRKAIECPQLNNTRYGKWGALSFEQRIYIKRLLDELDSADEYFKKLYLENLKQKEAIDKAIEYIKKAQLGELPTGVIYWLKDDEVGKKLLQILEDKGVEDNGN